MPLYPLYAQISYQYCPEAFPTERCENGYLTRLHPPRGMFRVLVVETVADHGFPVSLLPASSVSLQTKFVQKGDTMVKHPCKLDRM